MNWTVVELLDRHQEQEEERRTSRTARKCHTHTKKNQQKSQFPTRFGCFYKSDQTLHVYYKVGNDKNNVETIANPFLDPGRTLKGAGGALLLLPARYYFHFKYGKLEMAEDIFSSPPPPPSFFFSFSQLYVLYLVRTLFFPPHAQN